MSFFALDGMARLAGAGMGELFGVEDSSAEHSASSEAHTQHPGAEEEHDGLLGNFGHTLGQLGRGVQQEGILGALLDPSGMMDRQDAQEDLAARFNVSEEGGDDNNVTSEEFQQIARQYSDIRMGRSDLQINTEGMGDDDAQQFRDRTMEDIGDILQTDSGRELIGDLDEGALDADGETRRITRIEQAADVNSAAGGGDWDSSAHRHKQGYAQYRPGEQHLPGGVDARSDVTLFHELVHAHHSTNNSWAQGTVDEHGSTVDRSEFQAAGLGSHSGDRLTENAYRADRMQIGESGHGMRTLGRSDADMQLRTYYENDGHNHAGHGH